MTIPPDNALPTPSPVGFWSTVAEALRGSHRDYTSGPIGSAVLMLAIPMVLEMVLESVFAVVDVFVVGKLGPDAVAAVGLTESLLTLIYTVAMGLSIGAMAVVARRIGERDFDGAAVSAVQVVALGCVVSVILGVAGGVFAPDLLRAMGGSDALVATGVGYTRLMLGGSIVVMTLFLVNAVFRGAGNGAISMRALWLANGINIILCPCLVLGIGPFPALGITGAALGTTIGRGLGAAFVVSQLFLGRGAIRVRRRHVRFAPAEMLKIARLSGSGMVQTFIGMSSWIGLVRVVATFGSAALAGYTIGFRVIMFALLPSWGLSNAAATMVGQALGAKLPERAERAVWMSGFYNLCFLGLIGLGFVLFAGPLIALFTPDPEVLDFGTSCLRTVAAGFLFYAYGMVLTQAFNGAGDTWTPTLLNLAVFWAFEIPLAYALAIPFGMGPQGVFLAVTLAFSCLALASGLLFRRGKWKTQPL